MSNKPIIYLHIGPYKTGTTTIQKNLVENAAFLKKEDYHYPNSGMVYGGQHNLAFDLNKDKRFNELLGGISELRKELTENPINTIISSEVFSEISNIHFLEEFKHQFQEEFNFLVIPYLRRQDYLLASKWKMNANLILKNTSFDKWVQKQIQLEKYLNYEWWLRMYGQVFGEKNIRPIIYLKNNPEHFKTFLSVCGINKTDGLILQKDHNPSYTNLHFEIMRQFAFKKNTEKNRKIIRAFLKEKEMNENISFYNKALHSLVMNTFKESNQKVAIKYFNRNELFVEETSYNFDKRPVLHDLSKQAIFELANKIISAL